MTYTVNMVFLSYTLKVAMLLKTLYGSFVMKKISKKLLMQ